MIWVEVRSWVIYVKQATPPLRSGLVKALNGCNHSGDGGWAHAVGVYTLSSMRILLATSNPHKLDEILAIWGGQSCGERDDSVELVGLDAIADAGGIPEPVEDQPTFEGNAVLKARHYAKASGMMTLADDSGLEVDALGGQPGVRSARYADATGSRAEVDQANNDLLLRNLGDLPAEQRSARFVCAMAWVTPPDADAGRWLPLKHVVKPDPLGRVMAVVRGAIEGRIIGPGESPRGTHGFGYDPLFFVPRLGKTTAQLSAQEKNAISHRGEAAGMIWAEIQRLVGRGQGGG